MTPDLSHELEGEKKMCEDNEWDEKKKQNRIQCIHADNSGNLHGPKNARSKYHTKLEDLCQWDSEVSIKILNFKDTRQFFFRTRFLWAT